MQLFSYILTKLSIILDFIKCVLKHKWQWIVIIFLLSLALHKDTYSIIKKYIMTDAIEQQTITQNTNHEIERVLDTIGAKINKEYFINAVDKKPVCLIEYITIKNIRIGGLDNNYVGYVMSSREWNEKRGRMLDAKGFRLKNVNKDLTYGVDFSKFGMDNISEKNPTGLVESIQDTLERDDPTTTTMYNTFVRDGGAFYDLTVSHIGYSFIRSKSKNHIVGHPIILCNEDAYDLIKTNNYDNIVQEMHHAIVNSLNKIVGDESDDLF